MTVPFEARATLPPPGFTPRQLDEEAHRLYDVWLGKLAYEKANHRFFDPPPAPWQFLSGSERKAWEAVVAARGPV